MAEYHLHVTLPDGHEEAPDTGYGFTNSIAEWGRRVSVHLDGFSNDGVVLEPNTANQCRIDHRWVLDRAGKLRDASKNDSFLPLYSPPKSVSGTHSR